ncbi:hypothetical protein ACFXKI_47765 [Streptomyces mirabilis]|uniref:hypothetical protein n=1 Tax=Streptomyces mirabilis TaxID=68239 RepID=UPI0036871CF1
MVHAIRVLERMVPPGELLLSAAHHSTCGKQGALKKETLTKRIESFVDWANREAETCGLPDQTIPEDPYGPIRLGRFRRTLAWHIARRPGGLIALAIQYGHMRTVLDARTSSGYGSRGPTPSSTSKRHWPPPTPPRGCGIAPRPVRRSPVPPPAGP